jgi:hypothetical protein
MRLKEQVAHLKVLASSAENDVREAQRALTAWTERLMVYEAIVSDGGEGQEEAPCITRQRPEEEGELMAIPSAWGLVRKVQCGATTLTVTADEYGVAIFADGADEDPALISWQELDDARKIAQDNEV